MSDSTSKKTDSATGTTASIQLSSAAIALQNVAKPIVDTITWVLPIVVTQLFKFNEFVSKLPQNVINFVIGFVFCFSGGLYPVLFAAIEAAEFGGRQIVMQSIKDLCNEALIIIEESKKDDKIDKDNDGKVDVSQVGGQEYMIRKTKLVLRKMNPEKIDTALSQIYKVWLSVAAVLTIEFARAISMALAISDFMKKPVNRFVAPTIQLVVPSEYDKWVPVILGWYVERFIFCKLLVFFCCVCCVRYVCAVVVVVLLMLCFSHFFSSLLFIICSFPVSFLCDPIYTLYFPHIFCTYYRICKSIGMSIAWYIQSVRSAFASALTGGLMMSRAAYQALIHRNIKLGGLIPEDHTKSDLDEYLSYVFAALGFYFQYKINFDMPFPFNILFWPFELTEYYIRWTVTS